MKVVLVPGPRNEELIREIKRMKIELSSEEWEEYVCELVEQGDEYFDALYYACENGAENLETQARYFHELLLYHEKDYYAGLMGGFEI